MEKKKKIECVVPTCDNSTRDKSKVIDGISFHVFPSNDTREKWIKFVRNNGADRKWSPTEQTVICSAHFREKDFYTNHTRKNRYLKLSAVPCENPDENSDEDDQSSKEDEESSNDDDQSSKEDDDSSIENDESSEEDDQSSEENTPPPKRVKKKITPKRKVERSTKSRKGPTERLPSANDSKMKMERFATQISLERQLRKISTDRRALAKVNAKLRRRRSYLSLKNQGLTDMLKFMVKSLPINTLGDEERKQLDEVLNSVS